MYKSYLNNTSLPLGLRNNNPGNLIRTSIDWEGKIPLHQNTDPRFEKFYELRYGIRAAMRDLITGFKRGSDTVRKIISEYAPPGENNTANYISFMAQKTGLGADTIITSLTPQLLTNLCKAIFKMENGNPADIYITDSDYNDAHAILGVNLAGIVKKKDEAIIGTIGIIGIASLVYVGYRQLKN